MTIEPDPLYLPTPPNITVQSQRGLSMRPPWLPMPWLIDGYKIDHRRQYPAGTTRVYSNWTPRGSRIPGVDHVVFFGLQYLLERYFTYEISQWFRTGERHAIEPYAVMLDNYLGPQHGITIEHLRDLHRLGYLPLEFRALREGTRVPLRVPCLTVENTHDEFAWLTNYVETLLSNVLWLPCTSATTAHRFRLMLDEAAERTGGDRLFTPWQGHDFSMRGLAGIEAAQLSGAAHLLSFYGTDTVPALPWIQHYYPANWPWSGDHGDMHRHFGGESSVIGGSVPATEHSVMCAGGMETELQTFQRLLDLYPSGVVSVVSDTWDLWRVLTETLPAMRARILGRDGKLVIRPDSGNPPDVLCGTGFGMPGTGDEDTTPAEMGVVRLLWETFGGKINRKGLRDLDPHVGVIYGDAITFDRAEDIIARLASNGFSSTNVVFGIGSYNYQYVTRDTFGFAMKATWCRVNGEGIDLWKKPVTDSGEKHSARGRLAVMPSDDGTRIVLRDRASVIEESESLLRLVWRNGEFVRTQSFDSVRRTLFGGHVSDEQAEGT